MRHFLLSLIVLFVFIPTAKAGPRVVGNGGDGVTPGGLQTPVLPNHSQITISTWFILLSATKSEIKDWLRSIDPSRHRRDKGLPFATPMLFGHPNAYEILDNLNIYYQDDRACPSNNGHTDGSVLSYKDLSICISGYSLSSKIPLEDSENQIAALVLHEVCHLLGADEPEAIAIQERFLSEAGAPTNSTDAFNLIYLGLPLTQP